MNISSLILAASATPLWVWAIIIPCILYVLCLLYVLGFKIFEAWYRNRQYKRFFGRKPKRKTNSK